MIKIFKSEIYPFNFAFCIGKTIKEICDGTFKHFPASKERLFNELNELRDSTAFTYQNGGLVIISIPNDSNSNWHGTIAHEISHATFFVCERLGIDTTTSPQEAYCYLNGWITEKIYTFIEKDIVKG